MAYPRKRNDSSSTVYRVENALVGEKGEILIGQREAKRLSLMIRQADRLFTVTVLSFQVTSEGYSLICNAPVGVPSRDQLREHFINRYGNRREMPDFDDPDVYERWARRLRDFSCLIKDIQQRFTRWYNRVIRGGRRRGTLWQGRFQSRIIKTAQELVAVVRKPLGKHPRWRRIQGRNWRKTCEGGAFIRDMGISAVTGAAAIALFIPSVLLDALDGIPRLPFPLKFLREMVGRWEYDDH